MRDHIHHSHPARLYLFVESTLIDLASSLEPMIGSTPSDLCEGSEFDNWPVLTHGHADDICLQPNCVPRTAAKLVEIIIYLCMMSLFLRRVV